MVRAPCCEKMGLKKGPWTPEEDQILISYIHKNGHGNWRALPKQAGLLRCGKSCRLRWTNYLRPDIKRGNFTKEEEDTIIQLHEMLGNRWSAIAARLPGRTDNEIKNVWHTHLKKKLKDYKPTKASKKHSLSNCVNKSDVVSENSDNTISSTSEEKNPNTTTNNVRNIVSSPQRSLSEISSLTDSVNASTMAVKREDVDYSSSEYFPQIDESFWNEKFSDFPFVTMDEVQFEFPVDVGNYNGDVDMMNDDVNFWYNVLIGSDQLPELPNFLGS